MVSSNRSKKKIIENLGAFIRKKYQVPEYLMFSLGYLFRNRRCPKNPHIFTALRVCVIVEGALDLRSIQLVL